MFRTFAVTFELNSSSSDLSQLCFKSKMAANTILAVLWPWAEGCRLLHG